jgi:hypothetical protein
MKKINSDEAYELHMLNHTINRLIDAIEYYIQVKDEYMKGY